MLRGDKRPEAEELIREEGLNEMEAAYYIAVSLK